MPPPPPSPIRLLRSHSAQINVIHFSSGDEEDAPSNERLYTGDAEGLVVVTSTRSFRALASWRAHTKGILGIEEWRSTVLTHGRDNKIHAWTRVSALGRLAETAAQKDLVMPECLYSLDVNTLNFCRFSVVPASTAKSEAFLAVPNLVESSLVDVWHLPSRRRLHAAIGKVPGPIVPEPWDTLGRGDKHTGFIMSLHIMSSSHPSSSPTRSPQLRILTGYENGGVCLWAHVKDDDAVSIEGRGWEALWQVKAHVESVMGLAVSPFNDFAISISADHLAVRYSLRGPIVEVDPGEADAGPNFERVVVHKTKYPGNGSVAIRPDGKVFAVGSWDGKIRLYSTKSFKALGTLSYHSGGCQALAFAHPDNHADVGDEDEDGFGTNEREKRNRWLASGGVDRRVAIWELLSFAQK